MVILIAGGTHTGKTKLAQTLLERYHYPYLSIDHLKMGMIRSGLCPLSPDSSDHGLTAWFWPIMREMIKTVIENEQNLIVEGCYIPFDYLADFDAPYRSHLKYICLIFSPSYIQDHFEDIQQYANVVERRLNDQFYTQESLLEENRINLEQCKKYGCDYILIEDSYRIDDIF